MNVKLYKFTEPGNKVLAFRWTKKHYEFCMDNDIYLSHNGKKVYKERNLLLFTKGDKVKIEENVIAEQCDYRSLLQHRLPCQNNGGKSPHESFYYAYAHL